MKTGAAFLIPSTVLGMIAGVVGAIAVLESREPAPAAPSVAQAEDERAIADLANAVDRLTIALDADEGSSTPFAPIAHSSSAGDTAAIVQRLDRLIDKLDRADATRPGTPPTMATNGSPLSADAPPTGDGQGLALAQALAQMQSRAKTYDNLYAQQLGVLLDDPNASEDELLYAVTRCDWDDFDGEIYDVLSRAMNHENGAVRASAMITMLDYGDECIVPFKRISGQLSDPDERVRQAAIMLAGNATSPEAYETVMSWQPAPADEWAYVMALRLLEGNDFLTDDEYERIDSELARFDDLDADYAYDEFEEALYR